MKLKILLLIVMLLPLVSIAQPKSYKPGYIITTRGDSINGYVRVSGKMIWVKTNSQAAQQAFRFTDVKKLHTGNATYPLYIGFITMNTLSIDHMQLFRDTSVKLDTIFLQPVYTGRYISLYEYTDNMRQRFFAADNGTGVVKELIYRLYWDRDHVSIAEHLGRTVNENTYMPQIFELANKYNGVYDRLDIDLAQAAYRRVYLKEIFEKINAQAEKNGMSK